MATSSSGTVSSARASFQYDLGRGLPEGFVRKGEIQESLGRPSPEIRSQLAKLKSVQRLAELESKTMEYLAVIQRDRRLTARYPGAQKDRLFEADYRHITDGELCDDCGCSGLWWYEIA